MPIVVRPRPRRAAAPVRAAGRQLGGAAFLLVPLLVLAAVLSACGDDGDGGADGGEGDDTATTRSADDLAGTSWVLTGWSDGGDLAEPVADAEAVLDFATDGTLTGSGGCNRFFGSWEQDGSALTLTVGGTTEVACPEPVTAQEAAVLTGLEAAATFQLDGDVLLLLDDAGDTVLEYGTGVQDLVGTSWTATGINNGKEALVSTATTEQAGISFADDGTINGTGGCNTFSGPVTLTPPDGIDVADELRSTLRACADPAVDEQEQQFIAALQAATTYELSGSTLTLRDDQGAMQATFRLDHAGAGDTTSTTADPDTPVSSGSG